MAARPRLRHLTIFLLKDEVPSHGAALREIGLLTRYGFRNEVSFQGALYFRKPYRRIPPWFEFVQEGTTEKIAPVRLVSTAAVLLIEAAGRMFAVTFGFGRTMLTPGSYETDFGLKVALNIVDPDRLRSVDARRVEELTIHTTRQTSRVSPLETFGLDISRDLLRVVAGEPRDESFAERVTGADALVLSKRVEFTGIGRVCEEALSAYLTDTYKDRFGWIDHLNVVRDPNLVSQLNGDLVATLKEHRTDRTHMAAPEPLDWALVEGFYYPGERRDDLPHSDLDVDEFLDSLDEPAALTLEYLTQQRIRVQLTDQSQLFDRWSVYECLVFEVAHRDNLYVLSGGKWFQIEETFAREVDRDIRRLFRPSLRLPTAQADESEEAYNRRISRSEGFALLDQRLVRVGGTRTGVEVCDLLSLRRHFIHVKKRTRSATLSHLFAQGMVSGEAFFRDAEFRRAARRLMPRSNPRWARLIPLNRPDPSQYEVVYAVIAKPRGEWPQALPFFSQLHLVQASKQLRSLGYKVGTCRIEER